MTTSLLEQRICTAALGTDAELWATLSALLASDRRQARREVLGAFKDLAAFYTDSECRPLRRLATRLWRSNSGEAFAAYLLHRHAGNLNGVELSHRNGRLFAVLLADASAPGCVRASYFDHRGFAGHISRKTYAELALELAGDGYCVEAPGALANAFSGRQFDKRYHYQSRTAHTTRQPK